MERRVDIATAIAMIRIAVISNRQRVGFEIASAMGIQALTKLCPARTVQEIEPSKIWGQKGTTRKLCDKDFAERSGELSGAICLKTLVLLGNDPVIPGIVQKILWFCSCDFLAL